MKRRDKTELRSYQTSKGIVRIKSYRTDKHELIHKDRVIYSSDIEDLKYFLYKEFKSVVLMDYISYN